jgi:hypothetical protein
MIKKEQDILRTSISLLLVLCFLPFDAAYELTSGHQSEKNSKSVLLIQAFMECTASPAILNQQTKFNSFDEILKDALIIERTPIELIRIYIFSLTEFSIHFAQHAGQTIAIRAPPSFKS